MARRWKDVLKAKPTAHKSPPKGYPKNRSQYADPKRYKYPIDTEQHVRAAWSYIHQAKNRKGYSASELKAIEGRIRAAGKKFGIKFEKDGDSRIPGDAAVQYLDPIEWMDLSRSPDLENLTPVSGLDESIT